MHSKTNKVKIALDAMGGDLAPQSVLQGAEHVLKTHKDIEFLLFGNKRKIQSIVNSLDNLKNRSEIVHCTDVVASGEKPSVALRRGKNSSMRLAIDAVRDKKADAVVSSGNTGALMAMAKLVLRPIPGIDRPAICTLIPTKKGKSVLLDLGANVECTADNLVQFAIMGDAFAKVILDKKNPKVALLNVGTEDIKGKEAVRLAAEELREEEYNNINFCGFVEADGVAEGDIDVIVTDGFTGNVALKAFEGVAKICTGYVREALTSSIFTKFGALFVKHQIKRLFSRMDPRYHNGAMFVGLSGIAVKSHGGADYLAFAHAILVAYNLAINDINKQISEEIVKYEEVEGEGGSYNDDESEAIGESEKGE